MSDVVKSELAAIFRQKGFVLALLLIAASALGLNTAMQSMGLYFKKERVELRKKLELLPRQLGPWLQVSKDVTLVAEEEHALGTKDYITREYVDTRKISGFDRARWDALKDDDRRRAVNALVQKDPQASIRVHMAFYTGLVDTVAHVPERCYVAGGFDPDNQQVMDLNVFPNSITRKPIVKVKYTDFVDRARSASVRQNVAYFFQVNGAYEHDSIGGVRVRLQSITEKYGYYCKIEMLTTLGERSDLARETMSSFLQSALPEMEKCLPDWTAVTGKPSLLNYQ